MPRQVGLAVSQPASCLLREVEPPAPRGQASHLRRSADRALHQLAKTHGEQVKAMMDSFRQGAEAPARITVGSVFSGTDIGIQVLDTVLQAMGSAIGTSAEVVHMYSCEQSSWKMEWVLAHTRPKFLFRDAAEMANEAAFDILSKQHQRVPAVHCLLAGFVCRDMSSMSSNRQQYGSAIELGRGQSASTFWHLVRLMKAKPPALCFIENVPGMHHHHVGAHMAKNNVGPNA